jgi:multicomponent K+:H+ antiporter subunit A
VGSGVRWTEARIAPDYRAIAGAGILVAGLTGLGSLAFGYPFLTTAFGHFHVPGLGEIELATAMVFDLGVFATVTGTTLLIVSHLGVRNTPAARTPVGKAAAPSAAPSAASQPGTDTGEASA